MMNFLTCQTTNALCECYARPKWLSNSVFERA